MTPSERRFAPKTVRQARNAVRHRLERVSDRIGIRNSSIRAQPGTVEVGRSLFVEAQPVRQVIAELSRRHLQQCFGPPLALVHDLSKGILAAIQEVFPGIPDFICHFHFLRDLGKDLFGAE